MTKFRDTTSHPTSTMNHRNTSDSSFQSCSGYASAHHGTFTVKHMKQRNSASQSNVPEPGPGAPP